MCISFTSYVKLVESFIPSPLEVCLINHFSAVVCVLQSFVYLQSLWAILRLTCCDFLCTQQYSAVFRLIRSLATEKSEVIDHLKHRSCAMQQISPESREMAGMEFKEQNTLCCQPHRSQVLALITLDCSPGETCPHTGPDVFSLFRARTAFANMHGLAGR